MMTDRDTDIERRVEKLERENRKLKLAGGAVAAVLLAVALVGAMMPQEIPEMVEARGFRVVGDNGSSALLYSGGLWFMDQAGVRAQIGPRTIT